MNLTEGGMEYDLALTNLEVCLMFKQMVKGWFSKKIPAAYNGFIRALLSDDREEMNAYMNQIALVTFSYFDTGRHPSEATEPERFYHGFVLGLIVELADRYTVTSNREMRLKRVNSFGRYDVMLKPKNKEDDAALIAEGIPSTHIKKYGFAFKGTTVLIG